MAKWVRTSIVLDLKIEDGESFASVISDLTKGMSEGDPAHSRLISLEATEVEDYRDEPTEARGCCR